MLPVLTELLPEHVDEYREIFAPERTILSLQHLAPKQAKAVR
jgi:hypothetical protein